MKPMSRDAFTLIEALVVVAIITILVAIVLPVMSSARARGRAAVCTSNLRQTGQALTMYVADNDSTYPPALSGASIWVQKIQPYIAPEDKTHALLSCPDRQLPGLYSEANEAFPLTAYAYKMNVLLLVCLFVPILFGAVRSKWVSPLFCGMALLMGSLAAIPCAANSPISGHWASRRLSNNVLQVRFEYRKWNQALGQHSYPRQSE